VWWWWRLQWIALWSGVFKDRSEIHVVVKKVNGRTWFKTSTSTIPRQRCQKACWYLLTRTEKSTSAYTNVAFTWEYSRVSIFTRNVKCTRENQEHLRKEKVNMFLWVERSYLKFSKLILSN
jgi:hypothetical protein